MGDINIKSKNQSGGVTAQNVNVGNFEPFSMIQSPKKEGKLKAVIWWVFGLLGAAAAIVTVLTYFQPK